MASIFSRIVSGELPSYKVAEDEQHLAFLDITPLVEGHTLVIPKREVDYIFDMAPDELAALHLFAQRVAKGVQAAVPCQRIGVAVIGLEVPHAHIHLIPMNKVSDMNFANPKIKVAEARMKELAAAIAAKVPGGDGAPAASASQSNDAKAAPAGAGAPAVTERLEKLTEGLLFMSESDAPLAAVHFEAPAGDLSNDALLKLVGEPAGTPVETQELTLFLRNHTADKGILNDVALANRFKALQMYMKQELQDAKVYRIGKGPTIQAYALGRTDDGQLAGFKTVLTET
ncbi:nuclease A inhibitor family protein [Hymenobacter sp. BT491]|uniref:nuclease A inhibitor family protein n=1 Tax=Hymenobacter sp. BT491 TaxID=2766779 RepID=UPI0016537E92|nr:nuclease A inhibitor family protein [Hymenobacter sp. BT491]MBC6990291.1 HIT domain-containing protein [Hymenobacter sp. BT491]